jgi:hypothetical protein
MGGAWFRLHLWCALFQKGHFWFISFCTLDYLSVFAGDKGEGFSILFPGERELAISARDLVSCSRRAEFFWSLVTMSGTHTKSAGTTV